MEEENSCDEDSRLKMHASKGWSIKDLVKKKSSLGEDEEEQEEDDDEDEDDGVQISAAHFIDQEAEVSGSDASADEDEGDDDGQLEEDDVDLDLPDEEDQRNEIIRVKMRQDMDDDMMMEKNIKERIFTDGEFHRDGIVRRRQQKLRWRDDDGEQFNNTIKFNSDEEGSDEDDVVLAPVKITFVKIKAGEHGEVVDGAENTTDVGQGVEEEEEDEFESVEATRFEGAFGGPAGSILSYVIRDKATHVKMQDQKETVSGRMSFLKMRKKRFTRKGPIVKTVSDFEKRKLFSKL